MGRTIRSNMRTTTAIVCVPDPFAVQAASLGAMTNTFSPGSAGRHTSGTNLGFSGLPGYGLNGNRWSGEDAYFAGARQALAAPVAPVADPLSQRLGIGAGVAGQPGMPGTGDRTGLGPLQAMSMSQLMHTGMMQ